MIYGYVNHTGENNRNVAHMTRLLAGLPMELADATISRLCNSGPDAIGTAARAVDSVEAIILIAVGDKSVSRAPFLLDKAESVFSRAA